MKVEGHVRQADSRPDRLRAPEPGLDFEAMLADPSSRAAGFSEFGILGRPAKAEAEDVPCETPPHFVDLPHFANTPLGGQSMAGRQADISPVPEPSLPAAAAAARVSLSGVLVIPARGGGETPVGAFPVGQAFQDFPPLDMAEVVTAGAEAVTDPREADGPIRIELAMIDGELHVIVSAEPGVKIDQDEVEKIFSRMAHDFGVTSSRLSFRLLPPRR